MSDSFVDDDDYVQEDGDNDDSYDDFYLRLQGSQFAPPTDERPLVIR
jgi:hypothetical protein